MQRTNSTDIQGVIITPPLKNGGVMSYLKPDAVILKGEKDEKTKNQKR